MGDRQSTRATGVWLLRPSANEQGQSARRQESGHRSPRPFPIRSSIQELGGLSAQFRFSQQHPLIAEFLPQVVAPDDRQKHIGDVLSVEQLQVIDHLRRQTVVHQQRPDAEFVE